MKLRTTFTTFALGLAATAISFAGVKTDYDHSAHFERYQTFAWRSARPTNTIVQNSLLDKRVRDGVAMQMAARGMHEDARHPDVYMVYHANAAPRREIWGAGPGWGWGWRRPYWGGPAYVTTYVQGSIVLDMVDAKTNQLVWRAYMDNTGSNLADVQKEKAVAKLVKQAFKEFPSGIRKPD